MTDCIFPRGNFAQEGFGSAKMEVEKASLNGEGRQKGVGQRYDNGTFRTKPKRKLPLTRG